MITKYQCIVNNEIDIFLSTIKNDKFKEIVSYTLENGKRLRPMILIDIFNSIYNCDKKCDININKISLIVEFLHNISLILDDLPCMDNDIYRRNKLTVHSKYNETIVNIVTNFLITEIYNIYNKYIITNNILLLDILNNNLSKVSVGQYLDLNNNRSNINLIKNDINLKTYPLFAISFIFGYILAGGDIQNLNLLEQISIKFSMIFQICDDFEDYEEDKNKKCIIMNYVILLGKDNAFNLYQNERSEFIVLMKSIHLYSDLFNDIINYLNLKIEKYL